MKTSKPFATISYNTEDFLKIKLDELVRKRAIDFYAFIEHHAEEDEAKDHKHLYIMPNGQIDTDTVRDYLQEIDTSNALPLGCMPMKSSKWFDWYLYALHDVRYLASKGQARKYHYTIDDVITNERDFLVELVHTLDLTPLNRYNAITDAIKDGKSFTDVLSQGIVPIQQVYAFEHFYDLLSRNGRTTHTPRYDEETGELLPDDKK